MDKTFGYLILEDQLRKFGGWPSNKGLRGTTNIVLLSILFIPATISLYIYIQGINSPKYISILFQLVVLALGSLFSLYLQSSFLYKQTKFMEMIQKLSKFKYGVPNGLRRMDKFSKKILNCIYWIFYIELFMVSKAGLFGSTCDEWHGKPVICELLVPWYKPFKLNNLELTILILFHESCIFRILNVSFCIQFLSYYSIGMILIRVDDLKEKIEGVKFVRNQRRSKEFQYVIVYHQHILRLFRTFMDQNADVLGSVQIAINSTIIVCAGQFMLQRDIASAIILFLPIAGCFMLHAIGQRVIDASAELTATIYNLNWYDANVTLQKDVFIFMGATLEPLKLQHSFMGVLSYADMKEDFKKYYSWFNWLLNLILK